MDLATVEIPRAQAREAAAEYRLAARTITDPERRAEFEEIARAYRIAARDGIQMIALTPTIKAGGLVPRTVVSGRGMSWERRDTYLLPRLAVCRASAAYVYTLGLQRDGRVELVDSLRRRFDYRSGRIVLELDEELPENIHEGSNLVGSWTSNAWSSMVPIVPPKHRPPGTSTLDSYLVLWEVENWMWSAPPMPPGDPALLRRVGGDIYAVLAVWDLTDLERLVLAGRRP